MIGKFTVDFVVAFFISASVSIAVFAKKVTALWPSRESL